VNGFGQLEIGMFSRLTMRAHGGATYFFKDHAQDLRMRTFGKQTGWLKLATGKVHETLGALWHAGADMSIGKMAGLTLRAGYSFTHQKNINIEPVNKTLFFVDDNYPKEWSIHTMHFVADVDCSMFFKKTRWAPRIAGFYSRPIKGINAFKMQLFGGNVGIDIRWKV
jgi:hypothetical protein